MNTSVLQCRREQWHSANGTDRRYQNFFIAIRASRIGQVYPRDMQMLQRPFPFVAGRFLPASAILELIDQSLLESYLESK